MDNEKSMSLFDVLAVNLDTQKVRILDADKTRESAEAIVSMAVMRRGVEEEFFATAHAGLYTEGDKWMSKATVSRKAR